ncbi:MAG: hypothetical protein KF802_02225 [Bdellovibrionaceae bacterium]|nr:hypothetical protein [Pseudobdellovibrionaceae bacterium]
MNKSSITVIKYGNRFLDLSNKQEVYNFLFEHQVASPWLASAGNYVDVVDFVFKKVVNGELGFSPEAIEAVKSFVQIWFLFITRPWYYKSVDCRVPYMTLLSAIKELKAEGKLKNTFIYIPSKKTNKEMKSYWEKVTI